MPYCNVNPRVKDKDGNERDSKLWEEIMELTNDRALAKKLYAMYNDPAFKKLHKDDLIFDDAGEPSLESCLKNFAPTTEEERNAIRDAMLRKEGLYDEGAVNEGVEKSADEYRKLAQKVKSFNERSPYNGFASAYIVEKDGKLYLNVAYGSRYAETVARGQISSSELLEGIYEAVDPSMHEAVGKILDRYFQQGGDINSSIIQTIRDLLKAFEQDFYTDKASLRTRIELEAGRNIKHLMDRFYNPTPEMSDEERQAALEQAMDRIAEHLLSHDFIIGNMKKKSSPYEALKKMLDELDSVFFDDLMELTGDRAMAKDLYARFNDPDLKKNNPKLKLDKYGEPILESIFENRMDILECIAEKGGKDFLRKSLLRRLNNPSYREDNIYDSEDAARSVKQDFEKNSKYTRYFSLYVEKAEDGYRIGFQKQSLMPYEEEIAKAISSFINDNGLSFSAQDYIIVVLYDGKISARELAEAILNRKNKVKTLSNDVVSKMLLYSLDNKQLYSLIDKMNKRLPDDKKIDVNSLTIWDWDGVLGQLVDYINANAERMRPLIYKINDVYFSHESQKNLREAIAKIDEQNKPDKAVEEARKEQERKRRKLDINPKGLSRIGKFYYDALERLQNEYYEIIDGLEGATEGKDLAEKARIYLTTEESLQKIYDELNYYLVGIKWEVWKLWGDGEEDLSELSDESFDKIKTELNALQNRVAKMNVQMIENLIIVLEHRLKKIGRTFRLSKT